MMVLSPPPKVHRVIMSPAENENGTRSFWLPQYQSRKALLPFLSQQSFNFPLPLNLNRHATNK